MEGERRERNRGRQEYFTVNAAFTRCTLWQGKEGERGEGTDGWMGEKEEEESGEV